MKIKLADANLDTQTLKYIEYLTQKEGQSALDEYLKWAGWYECHVGRSIIRKQSKAGVILARAAKRAETWRLV